MERYTDIQYDDDLTVGADDYDESLYDGDIDLFEYVGEEESAITRLKTIILSIDWEITDEVLRELHQELRELKDIWYKEKVHLVYLQVLDKLSKYIYQEKSNANPNAIKLLLSFYTNLEKIVLEEDLPEEESKQILVEDIERFDKFKNQITQTAQKEEKDQEEAQAVSEQTSEGEFVSVKGEESDRYSDSGDILLNLKAIVFGIDWEITEEDLIKLDKEVKTLSGTFGTSKVRSHFLQGIGTLGNYINEKRSNSHIDAFKLLHSFFAGLERVVQEELSYEDEKSLLLTEVEKFNKFKKIIAPTFDSVESETERSDQVSVEPEAFKKTGPVMPALSDVESSPAPQSDDKSPEDQGVSDVKGEEGVDISNEMASRLENFFGGEFDSMSQEEMSQEFALQGVDVETEADDDSDEEELLRFGDSLAPALSDGDEETMEEVGTIAGDEKESDIDAQVGGLFTGGGDDDNLSEPLPSDSAIVDEGEVSPALGFPEDDMVSGEVPGDQQQDNIESRLDNFFEDEEVSPAFSEEPVSESGDDISGSEDDEPPSDIAERLDGFFDDSVQSPVGEDSELALQGVDVETEADDDSEEEPLLVQGGEIAPALGGDDAEVEAPGQAPLEKPESDIEDRLDGFFGDSDPALSSEKDIYDQDVDSEEEVPVTEPTHEVDEPIAPALAVEDAQIPDPIVEDDLEQPQEEIEGRLEGFFEETGSDSAAGDVEVALQGVDVETEADDDSDEEPLLVHDGEVAPALGTDPSADEERDEFVSSADDTDSPVSDDSFGEINGRLEDFFEEKETILQPEDSDVALLGVAVETDADDDSEEEPLQLDGGEIAPALGGDDLENLESTLGDDAASVEGSYALLDFEEEGVEDETLLGSAVSDFDEIEDTPLETDAIVESEEASEEPQVIFEAYEDDDEIVFEAVEDDQEEEVVFEAAEDREDEFLADLDLGVEDDTLVHDTSGLDDQDESDFIDALELSEDEDLESSLLDTDLFAPLASLQDAINDVRLEASSTAIGAAYQEVVNIERQFVDRPLEQTLLQLITTLLKHIDSNRSSKDSEPQELLQTIFKNIEAASSGTLQERELQIEVFTATSSVLSWQQRVIESLQSGTSQQDYLSSEPISDSLIEEFEEFEEFDEEELGVSALQNGDFGNVREEISSIVAGEVKKIESTFLEEISKLREELKKG